MTNVSEKGIDIVRRISGGGVMYHDQHIEVSYSVVARASNLGENPTRVRLRTCEAVVDALRLLGIPADTDLRNANNHPNLTVSNKIISCSTQIVKSGILLQQGYVLLRNNLPEMFNAVCIVQTNYRLKTAVNPENKATNIESELHHYVSAETVANALAQGFRAMLEINLQPSTLTNYETELAQELCEHKYVTDSWNQKGIEA
jgi:lipoate-protein ligase A